MEVNKIMTENRTCLNCKNRFVSHNDDPCNSCELPELDKWEKRDGIVW